MRLRSLLAAFFLLITVITPAAAAPSSHNSSIVTIQASGYRITVASHLADRWKGLIADFVAAGYKPRSIGCFARGGHVPNSRHYAGAACDFDQRGWGLTVPFMYRAGEIIRKHGFRDGCAFNDCGHVDDGLPGRGHRAATSHRTGHHARMHRGHRTYRHHRHR